MTNADALCAATVREFARLRVLLTPCAQPTVELASDI